MDYSTTDFIKSCTGKQPSSLLSQTALPPSDPDVEQFLSNIYLMVKKHSKDCVHCKWILESAFPK